MATYGQASANTSSGFAANMKGNEMIRVLILGAGGMLGHKAWQLLRKECQVYGTFRHFDDRLRMTGIFDESRVVTGIDAWDLDSVRRALTDVQPDWVLNCIGIIKQREAVHDSKQAIYVNALFPHLLLELCKERNIRLIHISTDCVFSGSRGSYRESDPSDADDQYGRTKYLGELSSHGGLTLRTSIIGRDLFSDYSLIDWFLSQAGKQVRGYARAVYSGLSTAALTREIWTVISHYPALEGLYHVSSAPITKYDLLLMANRAFQADVTITRDETFVCDRSLDSERFWREVRSAPPSWQDMVNELAQDPTDYSGFHRLASLTTQTNNREAATV
jgi:dTDP-4-dehydrorhamnose reductase